MERTVPVERRYPTLDTRYSFRHHGKHDKSYEVFYELYY
jgi:hypothetical protein